MNAKDQQSRYLEEMVSLEKKWTFAGIKETGTVTLIHYGGNLLVAETEGDNGRDIRSELQELLDAQEHVTFNDVRNYLGQVIELDARETGKTFKEVAEYLENRKKNE
jgi:phage tail sheath gpL-like